MIDINNSVPQEGDASLELISLSDIILEKNPVLRGN